MPDRMLDLMLTLDAGVQEEPIKEHERNTLYIPKYMAAAPPQAEVAALRAYFGEKATGLQLRFQLIFVPLGKKKDVVDRFDKLLEPFL